MAHNIFGERFYGTRRPAWHGIGTVMEEPIPAVQALRKIEADFYIEKRPLFVEIDGLSGKEKLAVPGKYAIVREPVDDDPTFAVLGLAGEDYEIVQRLDFAAALDRLTERWPLETIGVLGSGETVFFVLDAGEFEVGGEAVKQYFLVTDKVDGKTAARMAFTPIRVVCNNTLTTGLSQATVTAILDHRTGINRDFEFRVDLVDKLLEAQRFTLNVFELMTVGKLVEDEVQAVVAAAFPYPTKPKKMSLLDAVAEDDQLLSELRLQGVKASESYDYYCQRADGFRTATLEVLQKMNDENGRLANSPWYVWNSCVEVSDFRNGGDKVEESLLWGSRAKEKVAAFKVASSLIKN